MNENGNFTIKLENSKFAIKKFFLRKLTQFCGKILRSRWKTQNLQFFFFSKIEAIFHENFKIEMDNSKFTKKKVFFSKIDVIFRTIIPASFFLRITADKTD